MKHIIKKSFLFMLTALALIMSLISVAPASALASGASRNSTIHHKEPPAAPVVKTPPRFTRDATPVISGMAQENTRVDVWYLNDAGDLVQICRNAAVDDDRDDERDGKDDDHEDEFGHWSCTSSEVLPEREIELVVNATDKAGQTSPDTSYFFTVDVTAPDAPIVTSPSAFTNDTTPMISGTAEEGSRVNVWYLNNVSNRVRLCNDILVDELGNWSCNSSTALPEREIELVVNATDAAGNKSADASYFFTVDTTLVDTTAPTVLSIARASPNPTSVSSVEYTVTFSESVTGVNVSDFSLESAPTITGAAIDNIVGSGSTWTVTVNTGTGNGVVKLGIPVTATITDLVGNPLANLPFTSAETYTVEKTPAACAVTLYDDANSSWTYTGSWAVYTGPGPHEDTLHYTTTVGDFAELQFSGIKFTLLFTKDFNRGLIDVYVDGNKVDTINAYSALYAFQQTYTSPTYTQGNHTVRLVHAGSGAYIDIDAIQIFGTPTAVAAGTYDDTICNWVYTESWAVYAGPGPYNDTLHYTSTVGDSAELLFTGTKFTLFFTKDFNRGSIDVYVDGNKVDTVNTYSASYAFQQAYTSPTYTAGSHTLRLVHAGAGAYIDIDAITICDTSVPIPAGTYDDTVCNWTYTGSWAIYIGPGPHEDSLHYTSTVGDSAELMFTGTKFTLLFTKDFNRGFIDVYVDGNKVDTIDAYSSMYAFQQTYTSPTYTSGNHTVRLVHAGVGAYIDIDAIQIQ